MALSASYYYHDINRKVVTKSIYVTINEIDSDHDKLLEVDVSLFFWTSGVFLTASSVTAAATRRWQDGSPKSWRTSLYWSKPGRLIRLTLGKYTTDKSYTLISHFKAAYALLYKQATKETDSGNLS